MKKHPIQPLENDAKGVLRFRPNKIVQHLLDNGGINLNDLTRIGFEREEWEQFAQLIGYSLSGFGTLSYVSDEVYDSAVQMAENGKSELEARLEHQDTLLYSLRECMRDPIARLYGIHPSDLLKD